MGCSFPVRLGQVSWLPHSVGRNPHRRCGVRVSAFSSQAQSLDVVGIGQAMVDVIAAVDDEVVDSLVGLKGSRRIINVEERADVLAALDGTNYQVSAGGSLSNSLVALARLGIAGHNRRGGEPLRVGMLSVCGDDALGCFHSAQLRQAGVQLLAEALPGASTGTAVCLTTPDANRTFLSYLGGGQALALAPAARAAVTGARALLVEGYLWELPGAQAAIGEAVRLARASGAIVALTTGDAGLVQQHSDRFWALLNEGLVDVLFANRAEAAALLGSEHLSAADAALRLGPLCSLVAITDGANGSCLSALGRLQVVPPHWTADPPVDTCGAGDAYVAGLLYAYLSGFDLAAMGGASARVASAVISRPGACLTMQEAEMVIASLPAHQPRNHAAVFGALPDLRSELGVYIE